MCTLNHQKIILEEQTMERLYVTAQGVLCAAICASIMVVLPCRTNAQKLRSGEGIVLAIQDGEILIDLGTEQGLKEDLRGVLYRRVRLKHPLTGKTLKDLVPLAQVVVITAGEIVSAVLIDEPNLDRVKKGDVVRFKTLMPPPKPEARECQECQECHDCPIDEHAEILQGTWLTTLGKSVEQRIETWKVFIDLNSDSPYLKQAESELAFTLRLKENLDQAANLRKKKQKRHARKSKIVAHHRPISSVEENKPVRIVVFVMGDRPVNTVRLYYRQVDKNGYDFQTMVMCGDSHYCAAMPTSLLIPPGFEYFIEAQDTQGKSIKVHRSPQTPQVVKVLKLPVTSQLVENRSSARFNVEWSDFFLKSPGQDYFWKTEGDFTYKLMFGPFRSFRMGFGIFEGAGGPTTKLEKAVASVSSDISKEEIQQRLTVSYSYFEPEFAFGKYFAIIPRLVVGAIHEKQLPGISKRFQGENIFGFHTYLRIGQEDGTNLIMGGSLTQDMGMEALINMSLSIFKYVPIGISVAATNMPVGEDYAARLGLTIGWRQFDWMSIDALLGMNMRNIRHIGMGGGFGLTFNW
jgi:hypothetical protein